MTIEKFQVKIMYVYETISFLLIVLYAFYSIFIQYFFFVN